MSKIVVVSDGYKVVNDYVGAWYDGDLDPRPIYLHVYKDGCFINYASEDGVTQDIFDDIELRFLLPGYIYSADEVEHILEELKPITDKLIKSFKLRYNGNSYVGKWDQSIKYDLEGAIQLLNKDCYFGSLEFIDEHELNNNEVL